MYILYIVSIQLARRKKKRAKKRIFSNFSNPDYTLFGSSATFLALSLGFDSIPFHSSLNIIFKLNYLMIRVDQRGKTKLEEGAIFLISVSQVPRY